MEMASTLGKEESPFICSMTISVSVVGVVGAHHHVGHGASEASKEDDDLPLEVDGFIPEHVEDKDQSQGDHQPTNRYGEEHDEAELARNTSI